MQQVANHAGVSLKTVSNVVNNYIHVSVATRERVQRSLDQLGYRPHPAARNLARGRTGFVALAVPHLANPYFAELSAEIVRAAGRRGLTVLVDQTDGELAAERDVLAGLRGSMVDGVIFSPLAVTRAELAARADVTPLVLLGERTGLDRVDADHVAIDNTAASAEVVEHLLDAGRRRIAVIGDERATGIGPSLLRLRGVERVLQARADEVERSWVLPVRTFVREEGARAASMLIDSGDRPDALFCLNDMLALGAMAALRARGVRVPDDVAVAGFDDIDETRWSAPPLTSVAPDKSAIADEAVDCLLTRIDARDGIEPRHVTIAHHLATRESTGARAVVQAATTNSAPA